MKLLRLLIPCAAVFPAAAQPGMISGEEILSLVETAMQQEGQIMPAIAPPIRAFPECDHTPVVAPVHGQWSQAELRCDTPAPWRRVLRLTASVRSVQPREQQELTNAHETSQAVVVTRALSRGQRITAEDVALQPVPERLGTLQDTNNIIGRRARVALVPNQPVLERHLEPDHHISQGEKVTIQLSNGGIEIGLSGVALEDGWQGDRIRVRSWNSERIVLAEITAPGKVRVRPNIAP